MSKLKDREAASREAGMGWFLSVGPGREAGGGKRGDTASPSARMARMPKPPAGCREQAPEAERSTPAQAGAERRWYRPGEGTRTRSSILLAVGRSRPVLEPSPGAKMEPGRKGARRGREMPSTAEM